MSAYSAGTGAIFPGRVRADRRPAMSFRVPGRIDELHVDIGDSVKAGAWRATLDARDYRSRAADAAAAVVRAESNAAEAQRAADRAERLFAGSAVSKAERDRAQDLARSAQATLESTRQRRDLADRELRYTKLLAPEDGVIVERRSDPGANVPAGQPILALSGTRLEIRTDVPENMLTEASVGASAEVRISSLGAGFFEGKVVRVARGVSERSVLYPVFIRLSDESLKLVPGMATEVRFARTENVAQGSKAVSVNAVVGDPDGSFVWVLEPVDATETMVARRRGIELIGVSRRVAVIGSGVEVGERVATAGVGYLSEGQRVRPAKLAPLVFEGVYAPG
ncbi:MAG: efflux RND transporter periplasmic adaptor subunit, partial [Myxococcota bacterium]